MSINQVTAANTFQHWLGATQQLITKYNGLESDIDAVSNTANVVLSIKNDTSNIYTNTVSVYTDTQNVYNDVVSYTSTAYDIANIAIALSSSAYDAANAAQDISAIAYDTANSAYATANLASETAEEANTVATEVLTNVANLASDAANAAVNEIIYPVFDIDDVNSVGDTHYVTLTANAEYLNKVIVSTARMNFIPSTGTLTSNTFNATTEIKHKGSVVVNTASYWTGSTITLDKGGTGATTAAGARTSLGLGTAALATAPSGTIVGTTDSQTLTSKTLTSPIINGGNVASVNISSSVINTSNISNPNIINGYTEEVGLTVPGSLHAANGSIQKFTLSTSANWTNNDALVSGQSILLMINVASYSVTWPTGTVWVGNTAPTLSSPGFNCIELWKVGSTLYAASIGKVAS